jgi:hypothetical protein
MKDGSEEQDPTKENLEGQTYRTREPWLGLRKDCEEVSNFYSLMDNCNAPLK